MTKRFILQNMGNITILLQLKSRFLKMLEFVMVEMYLALRERVMKPTLLSG